MDDSSMNPAEDENRTEAPETPEDVAVLYTWANVHGGKYRDFSAERREHRAQQRHRMVEAQRQAELDAARTMEEAAARELEEARLREQGAADETDRKEAEEARQLAEEHANRERAAAQRHVETAENLKRAMEDAQRQMEDARRRAEEQAARYAEADARYRDSRREYLPGEIDDPYYYAGHLEPTVFAPGKGVRSSVPQRLSSERRIAENYHRSKGSAEISAATGPEHAHYSEGRAYQERRSDTPEEMRERNRPDEAERLHRPVDMRANDVDDNGYYDHQMDRKGGSSFVPPAPRSPSDLNSAPGGLYIPPRVPPSRPSSASVDSSERRAMRPLDPEPGNAHVLDNSRARRRESATDISARTSRRSREESASRPVSGMSAASEGGEAPNVMRRLPTDGRWSDAGMPPEQREESSRSREERPEWLGRDTRVPSDESSRPDRLAAESLERQERVSSREHRAYGEESSPEEQGPRPSGDTLQQSRERVAARWFALKGLVGNTETPSDPALPARDKAVPVPTLCVMSLSGGVGKTSMVATVGRNLSAMGERVLLADVTSQGLLPYYFGARELRPDVVRTFSPPPHSKAAPVFMVNYEAERLNGNAEGQAALLEEIAHHTRGTQRVLLDLNTSSAWLGRSLAEKQAKILVPITPDMNSVLGIKNMERFFAGTQDAEGRPVRPYYVLNQFDASLPLHLDVREVLRQQLGDRLLPVMIRRSPAVAEALAEGMTVMDYAPESPVAEDYMHLAEWARNLAAPAQNSMRNTRWSER
ncbi:cellulose synthase operon protein YhjQ/BcsQ [Terriglobus sp. TAA 43]|uniref:cellulose synthase operon protein YhjQ/BcsQ n=1 Tax=Terriglobus sp. TAA 43 TaxID=278961 RepID=UPI0012ED354E|nr:cellulose synthase operon protein YhjQ/BcsQ [Terriglobus sp. TAA 43]